jgi:hypothetical protein
MRMPTRTSGDLDVYLVAYQRYMKAIDVDYNVRMGFWASKNNV